MSTAMFKFDGMTPPQFLHSARKAINKVRNVPKYYRDYLSALLAWVDDNPVRFGPESAMGRLTEIIAKFDDMDDDDIRENDVKMFMRIVFEFFRSVTAEDISNVENWELTTNMSPNLLGLFGRPKTDVTVKTDWRAPDKAGLSNSDPAVLTEKNARPPPEKAESKGLTRAHNASKSVGFAEGSDEKGSQRGPDAKMNRRNSSLSSMLSRNSSILSGSSGRSEEDDDDEDDDDDDPYGYNDDDGSDMFSGGGGVTMSANLMKLLGMDTSHIDTTTDWKPPDKIGIEANPDSLKIGYDPRDRMRS